MAQAAHVAHAIDVDAIERFSLKLFIAEGRVVRPRQIIDIFHDWIRERAVPGLLIDVADYGHLPESPNVLLVAHEANYVFDCHRRAGFAYTVKRKTPGSLAGRIADAASTLFFAARRLQQDTADDPEAKQAEIEQRLQDLASPFRTAEATGQDIIDPADTRPLLCEFVEDAQAILRTQLGPCPYPYMP